MPSLTLNNVEFLQYSENMDFFDTCGFRLTSKREMTVKGELLALTNDNGVNPVLSQLPTLENSLLGSYYPDVFINGQNFGAGKMLSLHIDTNTEYIQRAFYTAKIQTIIQYSELTQEQFSSSTTTDYQGLNYLFTEMLPARYIRGLKEEYIYERNNDVFGYTHSISVSTFAIVDGLQRVKSFADQLFALTNPISCLTTTAQQLDNANYKPIYNEKFDLLNNDFSFVKKLSATNPDFVSNVAQEQTLNMTISENGITTCSENGTVKSLTYSQPDLTLITGACAARLVDLFNTYNNESFTLYPLNTGNPILNVFDYDQPNRTTSYQITYTNDPRYLSTYNWDYNIDVVKQGAYLSATEKGKIIGLGNLSAQMFQNAFNAYPSIATGILSRLSPLLTNYYPTVSTLTKNKYAGIIEYSQTYTENPLFAQSTSGIISMEVTAEDSFKVPIFNRYEVFNYGIVGQALTDSNTNSVQGNELAQRNVNINIQGQKSSTETSLKTLAQNTANIFIPSGNGVDTFLSECAYVYEPVERKFSLNAAWIYN